MKTFDVTFQREFTVQIEADNLEHAQKLAHQVMAQHPPGKAKLTSIEEVCAADPQALAH